VLDAPSLAMGKEEAEDTAEAALIIFSSNGQIDPRYLAAGTLAVNLAPRLISALPKVVAKVTKKKNVSGKT